MDYLRQPRHSAQNLSGFGAVVLLHAVLIYALVSGLGRAIMDRPAPPLVAHILDEVRPPPPPPALPTPNLAAPAPFLPRINVPAPPVPPDRPAPPAGQAPPAPGMPAAPRGAQGDGDFSPTAILGGAPAPDYPAAYEDDARTGRVTVDCVIDVSGNPVNCHVIGAAGGNAFAAETLRWLAGPGHPVYRPARHGGVAQREEHQWAVVFEPQQAESR